MRNLVDQGPRLHRSLGMFPEKGPRVHGDGGIELCRGAVVKGRIGRWVKVKVLLTGIQEDP